VLVAVAVVVVVVTSLTSGFLPARTDDTPNVKLLNCPGSTSTTDRAMAEATRVKEPKKPAIMSPTASVIFRILEGTTEEDERMINGEDECPPVAVLTCW